MPSGGASVPGTAVAARLEVPAQCDGEDEGQQRVRQSDVEEQIDTVDHEAEDDEDDHAVDGHQGDGHQPIEDRWAGPHPVQPHGDEHGHDQQERDEERVHPASSGTSSWTGSQDMIGGGSGSRPKALAIMFCILASARAAVVSGVKAWTVKRPPSTLMVMVPGTRVIAVASKVRAAGLRRVVVKWTTPG